MDYSSEVQNALRAELLCIADSNWVLGHWYSDCMLNGRELTDFTSMAGIAEDKLGHTRALFRFLEDYEELPEYQLEFGRDASQIHSMALLDTPPQNWGDFILTLFLADAAIWRLTNSLRDGSFAPAANLLTKFGEESYFHQLCIDGWLKALDESELADVAALRCPHACLRRLRGSAAGLTRCSMPGCGHSRSKMLAGSSSRSSDRNSEQ